MKGMLGLERTLKMHQFALDLDQIILRWGKTDLNMFTPIPLKLNFYHGLVDCPTVYLPVLDFNYDIYQSNMFLHGTLFL